MGILIVFIVGIVVGFSIGLVLGTKGKIHITKTEIKENKIKK